MPVRRRRRQAKAGCRERSQLRVSEGQDVRSERPAAQPARRESRGMGNTGPHHPCRSRNVGHGVPDPRGVGVGDTDLHMRRRHRPTHVKMNGGGGVHAVETA